MSKAVARLRAPAVLVLAGAAVTLMVWKYDAPSFLAGLGLLAVAGVLALRPEALPPFVIFLLYANVPAVAHQLHGVPQVLAGAFILALGVPVARRLILHGERPRVDTAFRLMLGFLCVLLLSSLFAPDKGIAVSRIVSFIAEGLLVYWLIFNAVKHAAQLRRVVWAVLAAGAFLSALSAYQTASGDFGRDFWGLAQRSAREERVENADPRVDPYVVTLISERASGPIGEPNRYAQTLIVLLPLAFIPLRHGRSRRERVLAAAAGLMILVGVALTYSRGAFLALLPLVAAAAAMRWVRPAHLVAASVCLGVLALWIAPTLVQRAASLGAVADLFWDRPSVQADGAIRGRATEMLAGAYAFLDHPILGVGPGQYMPIYSAEYHQLVPVRFRDLRRPRRAHSLYLEMAAETGLLGLTVFLGIFAVLLRDLLRMRRARVGSDAEAADLAAAFALAIAAYLITGVFLHLAYERYLWLLLALAAATLHITRTREVSHA